MNNFAIRIAQTSDAADIARIYKPYVEETAVSFEEKAPDADEIASRINKVNERHAWLVCHCLDELAGFAYASEYRSRRAYQWMTEVSVYVDERFRRRSVAKALYHSLHGILKLQGFVHSYAILTLPNPASEKFHLSQGFERFATFEDCGFKHGSWHSTAWMRYQIGSSSRPPEKLKSFDELVSDELSNQFEKGIEHINQ